ncbi:hypothetical protein TTHERM_00734110 (macronuclear) [Tetrahymena thermophila SB210]|uniref:Uncharacterized protein n=1 Tax=Tetrahymena thermophila (strain SB210) TaxID=312017 RepID=Q231Y6_TETTS|nr:hypothetical protein TTHERM_00734110 [Tetrahymena thermophila SB210]EAR91314.1 hypothetical protein TTHERM_00734110 [Tetrahymena thermophila SB210]|eukprot:XP_001011559.1 hypothetical protein TTHERM_00734110 [Tetrahymena thermophila SB210]
MDQKLVADILQAEIQVGRKIKQNQNNLKQFSEFNPEHAFETLKKFYINSYNLNSQQLQNSMAQSRFSNVPGSAYKGVVDIEKLTLLYRQYEETVSSFEIQAILSRHSAASDKGMDYDCFLKFIGFNLGDTKRKNTIFDSQARTERSLTERCMKALSSIFLLELDLLRFTEVHKVSLVNNYGFDSASFFAQIDYRNQSQIDFELLQQFFRRNGQEISLQDYQILLSRLKRNKQQENQFINRQEFIQLISPQLPYRGKNQQGQSVLFQSQAGQKSQVLGSNEKTVRFQDQSVVHNINQSSNNVLAQSQNVNLINQQQSQILSGGNTKILQSQVQQDALNSNYIQNGSLGLTQRYEPRMSQVVSEQKNYAFNQFDQQQQQQQPLYNQQSQILVQQPQQVFQQQPQTIIQQQPLLQSQPIFLQSTQFASPQNPQVFAQQGVQGQVGLPLIPGQQQSIIIGEIPPPPPGYVLVQNPPQTVLLPPPIQQQGFDPQFNNTALQQQQFQHQQEPQNDNRLLNEKRPNAVLEAMNQILQKDNDKLKRDNEELLQKVLKYEQYQQRESEEEQKRQREAEQKRQQQQQEQEEQQRKQQFLQFQQQQNQLSHVVKFPTHVTFGVPPNQINQPGVSVQSVPLNHQIIQSPVQSQILASPPMSPIRLVPAAIQPPEIQQRESVIAQQLISSQPPQPQAPTYILDPKQVPTYVVNDQPFIVNQQPTSQFAPNLLPKYNPQNLEIREAINQQFLPPLPFIQQGFSTHSKNQPVQDPYNGQAVTSHYPNRLNY